MASWYNDSRPQSTVSPERNRDSARILPTELDLFRIALQKIDASSLIDDNRSETTLMIFLKNLNRGEISVIDRERIQKITKIFDLLITINSPNHLVKEESLTALYSVLRCTLAAGHKICGNVREVARILEAIGGRTVEIREDHLNDVGVALSWDVFAQYAAHIVSTCTRLLRSTEPEIQKYEPDLVHIDTIFRPLSEQLDRVDMEDFERTKLKVESEKQEKDRKEEEKNREEEEKNIREWLETLSEPLISDRHEDYSARRHPNTGDWFLFKVRNWLENKQHSILWATGRPGIGKSVLASMVVDQRQKLAELLQLGDESNKDDTSGPKAGRHLKHINLVAHIYFNWDERASQNPLPVYARLLLQLFSSIPPLQKSLKQLMEEDQGIAVSGRNIPALLQKLTEAVISLPSKVLLVFDALDEASEKMRMSIENLLLRIKLDQGPRILLFSRPDAQIPSWPSSSPDPVQRISIEGSRTDISKFIETSLKENKQVMSCLERTYKKNPEKVDKELSNIVTELKANINDMFLLASLRVGDVCSKAKRSVAAMKAAAKTRDADPDNIYTDTWTQIKSSDPDHAMLARNTIAWLTFAKRPLNPAEVTDALAVMPGAYTFDDDDQIFIEHLQEVCRGLVVVLSKGRIVRLAHPTVREHFSKLQEFRDHRLHLARVSFTYLTSCLKLKDDDISSRESEDETDSSISESEDEDNWEIEEDDTDDEELDYYRPKPLMDNMPRNVQHTDSGFHSFAPSQHPYSVQSTLSSTGLTSGSFDDTDSAVSDMSMDSTIPGTTQRGFPNVISFWMPPQTMHCRVSKPFFSYAAIWGRDHLRDCICEGLHVVDMDSEILDFVEAVFDHDHYQQGSESTDSRDSERKTKRIHLAVFLGCQKVVEQLLRQSDCDVEARDGVGRTPLMWAALTDSVGVFRILLSLSADINATDQRGYTALKYAALLHGDKDLLRTVVQSTNEQYRTPELLVHTVRHGNLILAEALLDAGVQPVPGKTTLSPLHVALQSRDEAISLLLLGRGASTTDRDRLQRTPLISAIFHDLSFNVISRLIKDDRSDINALDWKSTSALHWVCLLQSSAELMIKRLISRGADVLLASDSGAIPLHIFLTQLERAIGPSNENENLRIVELLTRSLDGSSAPAILHVAKEGMRNALHLAFAVGDLRIMTYLMETVFNERGEAGLKLALNQLDSNGSTPILVSKRASPSHLEYVLKNYHTFIDANKGLDDLDHSYLHVAISRHLNKQALKLIIETFPQLLDRKARDDNSPLTYAMSHLNTTALAILLEYRVEMDLLSNGRNAFVTAVRYNHGAMLNILLAERSLDEWLTPKQGVTNFYMDDHGNSVLHGFLHAANDETLQILEAMLTSPRVDLTDINAFGETPLHIAVSCSPFVVFKKVLEANNHPNPVNVLTHSGKSALDIALERADGEIIYLLLVNNARPGLVWNLTSPSMKKWRQKPWYGDLKAALERPLPALTPDYSQWRYDTVKKAEYISVYEYTKETPYIEIEVPYGASAPVRRLRFETTSHDQGWSDEEKRWGGTYNNSWTWFEAGVKRPDGRTVDRRTIQRNMHARSEFRMHANVWDFNDPSPGLREWLGAIEGGDIIQVFAKALFSGWCNYVQEVQIELWCDSIPRELSHGRQGLYLKRSMTAAVPRLCSDDGGLQLLKRSTS